MSKSGLPIISLLLLWGCGQGGGDEVQFRYAKVERGELTRSIQATGQLVALTSVDIRSKAGGRIDKLLVEEGSVVRRGELLAVIDPSDTRAVVEQAQADVSAAAARADQARLNLDLERKNRATAVRDAEVALALAQTRLERTRATAASQPELTQAALGEARANLASAEQAGLALETVEIPQMRADSQGAVDRAQADLETARAELDRQKELYSQDFISRAQVERAQSALAAAQSNDRTARQRLSTLDKQIDVMRRQQRARLEQAQAAVRQAIANQSRDTVSAKDLVEAQRQVEVAQINVEEARNALANVNIRAAEARSASASTVRSRVALGNAQVQLDSTTVLAPRDGVVTRKYLEAGTIIPPGTSTFSQGTAIVQISDVTRMFVECTVDEADISQVRMGQRVRIQLEAYPGDFLNGRVTRINPAAETESNITAIRVRIEVQQQPGLTLFPGMSATCEFLTLELQDALTVPQQAIQREGRETFVRVKGANGQPQRVPVKLGESGNGDVQILSGLSLGQEVVIAEVNLAEMRELQRRMQEAQQGGGLAGGRPQGGGRAMGTGGGGGGR